MKNNKKRKQHEISGEPLPGRPAITKRRKLDKYALIEFFEKKISEKAKNRKQQTPEKVKSDTKSICMRK